MGIHEIANNAKELCIMLGNKMIVQSLSEHEYLLYQSVSDMLNSYYKSIKGQIDHTIEDSWKS